MKKRKGKEIEEEEMKTDDELVNLQETPKKKKKTGETKKKKTPEQINLEELERLFGNQNNKNNPVVLDFEEINYDDF